MLGSLTLSSSRSTGLGTKDLSLAAWRSRIFLVEPSALRGSYFESFKTCVKMN